MAFAHIPEHKEKAQNIEHRNILPLIHNKSHITQ